MRLIDADYLTEVLSDYYNGHIEHEHPYIIAIIQNVPTVDAAPVVRGKWERLSESENIGQYTYLPIRCSLCKCEALEHEDGEEQLTAFCPNCGAKMEADNGSDI